VTGPLSEDQVMEMVFGDSPPVRLAVVTDDYVPVDDWTVTG
jgi:hypothetical protein